MQLPARNDDVGVLESLEEGPVEVQGPDLGVNAAPLHKREAVVEACRDSSRPVPVEQQSIEPIGSRAVTCLLRQIAKPRAEKALPREDVNTATCHRS